MASEHAEFDAWAGVFDSLKALSAAHKARGTQLVKVSFGPTAASKTLFALRPHVFVAWDNDIRSMGHDGSGASYVQFLKDARGRLGEIASASARPATSRWRPCRRRLTGKDRPQPS